MSKVSSELILEAAGTLFADHGFVNFSVRAVAKKLRITPSLIYYYFKNQDELLVSMFRHLNRKLGEKRAQLPLPPTAKEMLKQRIAFQIDNQSDIVAVLKYYQSYRPNFKKFKDGFLPDKSALHIEEVLEYGKKTGDFKVTNIQNDSKVITHAINGYLLEFHPHKPSLSEKKQLIESIYSFIVRAL